MLKYIVSYLIGVCAVALVAALPASGQIPGIFQPNLLSTGGPIGTPVAISAGSTFGSVSSKTFTTTGNIVAGDLSLVIVTYYTGTATISAVSDGTNTYAAAVQARSGTGTPGNAEIWYKANASGVASGATVTITFSGGNAAGGTAAIVRVSGISTSSPLDKTATDLTVTGTPTVTTAALSQSNEIAFGIQGGYNATVYTESSGFTNMFNSNTSQVIFGFGYKIATATTAITYQPTASGGVITSMAAAVATFKGF